MKNVISVNTSQTGFTLLELIIFIIIGGILAAFLITFMGTAVTRSGVPVNQTRDLASAVEMIEEVTAVYEHYLREKPLNGSVPELSDVENACGYGCTWDDGQTIGTLDTIQVTVTAGDHQLITYFMTKN